MLNKSPVQITIYGYQNFINSLRHTSFISMKNPVKSQYLQIFASQITKMMFDSNQFVVYVCFFFRFVLSVATSTKHLPLMLIIRCGVAIYYLPQNFFSLRNSHSHFVSLSIWSLWFWVFSVFVLATVWMSSLLSCIQAFTDTSIVCSLACYSHSATHRHTNESVRWRLLNNIKAPFSICDSSFRHRFSATWFDTFWKLVEKTNQWILILSNIKVFFLLKTNIKFL